MATYSGALAQNGLPELVDDGDIDFPAMTLRRAIHVSQRREDGSALVVDEPPGLTPDRPLYVYPVRDDVVRVRPEMATASSETALTVSTTAVRLAGTNAGRKCITVTNNGSGDLYIGFTGNVASSGASMGRIVATKGSYSDTGEGVWAGELWGIYSAVASSPNVAVCDEN